MAKGPRATARRALGRLQELVGPADPNATILAEFVAATVDTAQMIDADWRAKVLRKTEAGFDTSLYATIAPVVSTRTYRSSADVVKEVLPLLTEKTVLDFGCGANNYSEFFRSQSFQWTGLDVRGSQDPGAAMVAAENEFRTDVVLYDGFEVPFPNESFEMVFSNQSLEHVHDCVLSMNEIYRVLKPGGHLVGSVSHLEAYHGFSTFNYTPYGFKVLCERSKLEVQFLAPGIDSLSLILRSLLNTTGNFDCLGEVDRVIYELGHSRLNTALESLGRRDGLNDRAIAVAKLGLCGQFWFWVRKPGQVTE